MYINTIDDLINKVIDDYGELLIKNKQITSILSEPNFVKYQKDINNIWKSYIDSIKKSEIESIVKKADGVYSVYNTIKKYISIYTFLLIGYNYKNDTGMYLNNIIEFTKNQPSYNFKIDDFFNATTNALIIDYYHIIKNILHFHKNNITNFKSFDIKTIKSLQNGENTIKFLEQFDEDYIKSTL